MHLLIINHILSFILMSHVVELESLHVVENSILERYKYYRRAIHSLSVHYNEESFPYNTDSGKLIRELGLKTGNSHERSFQWRNGKYSVSSKQIKYNGVVFSAFPTYVITYSGGNIYTVKETTSLDGQPGHVNELYSLYPFTKWAHELPPAYLFSTGFSVAPNIEKLLIENSHNVADTDVINILTNRHGSHKTVFSSAGTVDLITSDARISIDITDKRFLVRSVQFRRKYIDQLKYCIVNVHWQKVLDDIYLPERIEGRYILDKPGYDLESIVAVDKYNVRSITINTDIEDGIFNEHIPPRKIVYNYTVSPLNRDGMPIIDSPVNVVYGQPADLSSLPQVIYRAQIIAGREHRRIISEEMKVSHYWLSSLVVFCATSVAIYCLHKGRRSAFND